jgi:hypothetical protein
VIAPPFAPLAPVEQVVAPAMDCGVPGCIVCRPPGKRMSAARAARPARSRFCPGCGGPLTKAGEACTTPGCRPAARRDSAGPVELRW